MIVNFYVLSHILTIGSNVFGLQFDQMMRIVELLGLPPTQLLDQAPKTKKFFDRLPDKSYVCRKSKDGKKVSLTLSDQNLYYSLAATCCCVATAELVVVVIIILWAELLDGALLAPCTHRL